jgi:hypothetical protein
MKTIKILSLVSLLSFGFAGAASAGEGAATRGQVQVPATAAKAVVVGPTAIHAYSEFSGAKLFVADAVTGTDRDCQAAASKAGATALAGDKVETLTVRAGQIACVASTGTRPVELLWHTSKDAPAPTTMLAKR